MKISNDLRWMNSGPLAGLAEIALPALQPGSSIMPGKVNPVVPESATMIAAQVIGNDATITIAGQSGNFQLNVMLPVIAYNIVQSIELIGIASRNLAEHAIAGFEVNEERLREALDSNPILVTALNPIIGYEKGAAIAKKAYAEGRPILEVAAEMTAMSVEELRRLLDPLALTGGGMKGPGLSGYDGSSLYQGSHPRIAQSVALPRRMRTCCGSPADRPRCSRQVRARAPARRIARGRAGAAGRACGRLDRAAHATRGDAQGSRRPDQLSRRTHRTRRSGSMAGGAARGA